MENYKIDGCRKVGGCAAVLGALMMSAWGYVPEPQPVKSDVEITAIYYPGTDQMSEWDVIAQTCPERRPLLGWFDEGNPEAIDWQIKWAVEHGITSFCVDWYWNKGFRRLEHWVKGYYKAKYRRHLKWFMMYANHNQPGAHSTEDQIAVTKYWIDNYFKTPEYYTIDGKPAVCYWDAGNLDRDFIAEAAKKGEKLAPGEGIKRAFAISERMVREAGLPGIYWIDMWRTKQFDPAYAKQRVEQGYRAAIHYGFEHYAPTLSPEAMKPGDTPNRFDYDAVVKTAPKIWNELSVQDTLPFWVIIPTGWDDRPRSFSDSRVITGRTPEKFAEICRQAKAFCDRHGRRHAIIMPMNEWQEGSYIEPNGEYGFGMYDAIREAFCTKPKDGWPKNLKPEDVGLGPYDYPPLYRSQAPSWEFDDGTTGGWYRQPYGGGELESKDGCLHFWINWWKRNYNIRQRMVPFAAKKYAKFRVRMRVTPNAATGMNGVTAPDLRIKWGTAETPIIGKGLVVDEVRNVASCPVKVDGEFHEYEIDLKSNPDWKGEIDELWFEACQVIHARAAIDWMRFVTEEEDADAVFTAVYRLSSVALPKKAALPKEELYTRSPRLQRLRREGTLFAEAEKALADKPTAFPDDLYLEYWTTGDRQRFQQWKGRLENNLETLAAAEAEEGKGRFLKGIEERLAAVCDMKSWVHPAHDWSDGGKGNYRGTRLTVDLGCASIGASLACVLQLVGDRIDPKLRARAVAEIRRRIIEPLRRELPFHQSQGGDPSKYDCIDNWWISAENNWNSVCWDGVLCAVLGTVEDVNERAYFVDAARKSIPYYVNGGFGDDGYCSEGMGYWNYGFGHFMQMGLMLRRISNGGIDVFALPKLRRIAQYAYSYRLSGMLSPSFADGTGAPEPRNLAMVEEIWPDLSKELPPETSFASSQIWLWRDPQGVSVAFKGGHNDELHNHNDVGSYWVTFGDKPVAGDPGSEVYTRRTFSGERYESKVLNSYGHPVPVVGGKLQSTGRQFAARVIENPVERSRSEVKVKNGGTIADEGVSELTLDLKGAYEVKTLKTLTRSFRYDRKTKRLMIKDHVEFTEPTEFESPFNTYLEADNSEVGKKLDPWADYGDLEIPRIWNVRPQITAEGGEWQLKEETIVNPNRWSPHRVAVHFTKPVLAADVTFVYSPAVSR